MQVNMQYLFFLILIAIHAAFAQPDPCRNEIKKADTFYEMCANFDKNSSGYSDCVKIYAEQKSISNDMCKTLPPAPPAPWVIPELPPEPPAPWQMPEPEPAPVEAVASDEPVEEKSDDKEGVRLGIRTGFNVNDFSFGYSFFDKNIGIGMGLGTGLALNVPVASYFKFNMGLDFYYRQLFGGNVYYSARDGFGDMRELIVSLPVLLQIGKSFYFATGVQLDFPIITWNGYETANGYYFKKNRSFMDFGIALGPGYMFKNVGVDFKYVYGLTSFFKDFANIKDKSSLMQYGLGVSYFF
jgi:hypothetical protein